MIPTLYRISRFSFMCQKICENRENVLLFFLFASVNFQHFKNFHIANNTGYKLCVMNILQCKRDLKKSEN